MPGSLRTGTAMKQKAQGIYLGPFHLTRAVMSVYHVRESLGLNDGPRRYVRQAVIEHTLTFSKQPKIKMFTLPSENWYYEKMMLQQHSSRSIKFIGVEQDFTVYGRSVTSMPGVPIWSSASGYNAEFTTKAVLYSSSTYRLSWDLNSVNTEATPRFNCKSVRYLRKRVVNRCNACWLDFCGQLSGKMQLDLCVLQQLFKQDQEQIPLAITILAAREPKNYQIETGHSFKGVTDDFRASILVKEVERKLPPNREWYVTRLLPFTSSKQPMLLVMGVVQNRHAKVST